MTQTPEFPLPLYLNQRAVFDTIAMLEGGIAKVESVQSTHSTQDYGERRVQGAIGVSNVFALFGIRLGAQRSAEEQTGDEQQVSAERIHTPNSLFARLRARLFDLRMVRTGDPLDTTPGDFIEFQAALRKNPLIEVFDAIESLLGMASISEGDESVEASTRQQRRQARRTRSETSETELLVSQVRALRTQLQGQGSFDLIGQLLDHGRARAVLTLDSAFLTDPSLADLLDGHYQVFGKVTRVVPSTEDYSGIRLFRKTGLGVVQEHILQEISQSLEPASEAGFDLPPLEFEVAPPCIQIIPVAIFA